MGALGFDVVPTPLSTPGVEPPPEPPVTEEPPPATEEPPPPATEAPPVTQAPPEPTEPTPVEPVPTPTDETAPASPEPAPAPEPTSTTPAPAVPWHRDPAAVASDIPLGALLSALLVLVLAGVGLVLLYRRGRRAPDGPEPSVSATSIGVLDAVTAPIRTVPAAAGPRTTTASAGVPVRVPVHERPVPRHTPPTPALPPGSPALPRPALPPDPSSPVSLPTLPPGPDEQPETVQPPAPAGSSSPVDERPDAVVTVHFLLELGEAMIDSSAPVVQVTQTLERVAAINGAPDVEIIALPTAVLVSVPGGTSTQTAASTAGGRQLRLHQVQEVLDVADLAEAGVLGPADGTARIRAAVSAPPLYSGQVRVLGYVAVSAGLAMILGGSLVDVLVACVLGAAVAGVQVATLRLPAAYQALVVLTCSFAVSVTVFLLFRSGIDVGMLAPLVAPLVTFLPGALLTTAAIDLATRQMIAGAARLAAGGMQLVLLALGITAAAALVGVPAAAVGTASHQPLGWAGPWLGVLVYGTGVVFHNCARRSALPWILLVLGVAYAGQVLGGLVFGSEFSAFVGALAMTPVAMFAATRPTGPPTLVGFLPGFWLLVPGALGLVGVTSILGEDAQALTTVVTAATTMVAISLGVIAGLAVGSAVSRRGRAASIARF